MDIAFWDLPYYVYAAIVGAKYAMLQTERDALDGLPQRPTVLA